MKIRHPSTLFSGCRTSRSINSLAGLIAKFSLKKQLKNRNTTMCTESGNLKAKNLVTKHFGRSLPACSSYEEGSFPPQLLLKCLNISGNVIPKDQILTPWHRRTLHRTAFALCFEHLGFFVWIKYLPAVTWTAWKTLGHPRRESQVP